MMNQVLIRRTAQLVNLQSDIQLVLLIKFTYQVTFKQNKKVLADTVMH